MLQAMRHVSKSLAMKIILGFLALTFVVFFGNSIVGSGSGLFGGGGAAGSIVTVGDNSFTAFDVGREFNNRLRQAQANPQFANLTQQQAIELGLLDQTVNQIVTRALFDLGARDLGIVASDTDVSALVRQVPQFQNSAGRFDRRQFENFLRNNELSEQQYINQLRGDLIRNQLVGTLNAGVKAPDIIVDRFYRYNGERRTVEIALIDAGALTDIVEPDEVQTGAFYETNKKRFETPELRSGMLAALTPENLAEGIGISDAEIAAAYDLRKDQFSEPERREIESSLFDSKDTAAKTLERIRAGEGFAAVVEEITGLPPVKLGRVAESGAPLEEIGKAAFALPTTGVSEPFETPFGWNLVHVSAVEPAVEKSLADMRDEIRDALALEKAHNTIFDVLQSFEDSLAGGATLEAAASENGLKPITIGPVSAAGVTPDGTAAANVDREIASALFATPKGELSRVVERRDGGFFALRVDDIRAPAIPPLSEIREKVVAAWREQERSVTAEKLANEIAEQARTIGSLTAAAAKAGFTTKTTKPFDRAGNGADMPVEAVGPVFEAKPGDIVQAVTASGAVVVRLVEVVAAPADAPEINQLRGAIAQSISTDLQIQLVEALRTRHKVEVDSARLKRMFSVQ